MKIDRLIIDIIKFAVKYISVMFIEISHQCTVHAHLFDAQGKVVFFVNTLLISKLLPCPCPRRLEYQVHSVDEV